DESPSTWIAPRAARTLTSLTNASTAPMSAKGYRPGSPAVTNGRRRGSETCRAVQRSDVLRFELADLAGAQLAEPDRPDADADEPAHRELDRVEHPADLTLAPLDHHQSDPTPPTRAAASTRTPRRSRVDRLRGPVVELDTATQARELTAR